MPKRVCMMYFLLVFLPPIIWAKYQCPLKCDCTEDFSFVKCRDMENFPVFGFAKKVEIMDLTHGKIKSIHEKEVKAYPNLEKLFIKHNPLTCNEKNLHVLKHALREELGVKVFDGYKVKCKGKMDMEDSRRKDPSDAIQLKIVQETPSYQSQCQEKGTCMSSGQVAGTFVTTFIALFCLGGICWLITHYRHRLHRMLGEQAAKIRPVLQAEEGLGTRTECAKTLEEGLKKHRRKSRGIPKNDIVTSDEEDVVDKEQYIKGKLNKQRRRSQGYPEGFASSSDEDTCVVEINLKPEKQPCDW